MEVTDMTDIQVYTHNELGSIRVLDIDGEPWFVGKDLTTALGYSNSRDAISKRVDVEDKKSGVAIHDSMGRNQNVVAINESGMYSLILSSKLPSAKKFKRWVTSEVLPAIRKTGIYSVAGVLTPSDDPVVPMRTLTPDDYLSAARLIAGCKQDRLPVIISLLQKGGWDLGEGMALITSGKSTADIGMILKRFTDEQHGKLESISELTGISPAVLRSYRVGLRFPRGTRYESIVKAIEELSGDE
jgi:prophage antirepressor-like protein